MKTKLLTAAIVCALLLSITGCAADKAEQMLHDNVEITVNTDAVTEPSADTQAVALTAETAEKEKYSGLSCPASSSKQEMQS